MVKYIDRTSDEEIIDVVRDIFSQGTLVVETINESILVKLMEKRGTPITNIEKVYRDMDADFTRWKEDNV